MANVSGFSVVLCENYHSRSMHVSIPRMQIRVFKQQKYYVKVGYRSSFSDKTRDLMRMDNKEFAPEYYVLAKELQCKISRLIPHLFSK